MTTDAPALLVVTGLQREATIAAATGIVTLCSGGRRDVLTERLDALRPPLGGVLSFGLAGGLSPDLQAGDLVVATHILDAGERHPADQRWHDAIVKAAESAMRVRRGAISGRDAVLANAADKAALHAQTGAAAVDMESHIAAAYARKHRLPFAAIRAISDPVTRSLPALAAQALTPDGAIDLPNVIGGIMRRPGQLPALIAAGIDSERAFASLRRCRGLLGPLFGLGGAHL